MKVSENWEADGSACTIVRTEVGGETVGIVRPRHAALVVAAPRLLSALIDAHDRLLNSDDPCFCIVVADDGKEYPCRFAEAIKAAQAEE